MLAGLAGREETDAVAEAAPTEAEEAAFVEMCRERRLSLGFCLYKALKAQALYVMGRPAEALEATLEIEDKLNFIVNHPTLADHRLYQSLAMTALYPSGDAERDARTLDALDANLRRLDAWAESGPQNFLAKRFMVAAEIARIRGEDAADLYDRAIEAAHENELPQDEAVANELAARFVMETRPRSRIAAMYMRDAHYAYRLWGAERKVEELELEFPELVAHYRDMREGTLTSIEARKTRKAPNTAEMRLVEFDVETLLKAAETISGEFVLSRLLDRLLGILIENVGAQRGVLALARDGALFVEAAADLTSTSSEVMMSIPLDAPEAAALAPVGVLNFVARTGEVVVMDDALSDERFVGEPYIAQRETRSVLCQPLHNQGALIGLIYLENDLIPSAFSPERAHLVSLLSGQIAISIRNAELVETLEEKVRERTDQLEVHSRFIEQTFGRYLSSQVVDRLLKSPDGLDFRGHNQVVTIMSTDLRGFSTFADTLPPETIVTLLNNYLSEMTQVVEQYNGTIDAFIGDSILTVFGVPFQRPDDAERAVACALQMQLAMKKVNAWNAKQGLPELEMGIGIATGEAVVGNIGSRKRAKFGAVGRNVNLAVRVEGYTVGGQVLITEGARDAVQCEMRLRDAGAVEPKGFLRPVPLFEVLELGGKHALAAPRHEFDWTALTRPEPVAFRLVTDKKVMGALIEGVVTQLCQSGARIVSDTPPPVSTDLQLELKARDGSLRAGGICGKIVPGGDAEGGFVLRFTAMPPEARAALAVLLDDGAPAREAVDSAH